jgi:hypothetical protein
MPRQSTEEETVRLLTSGWRFQHQPQAPQTARFSGHELVRFMLTDTWQPVENLVSEVEEGEDVRRAMDAYPGPCLQAHHPSAWKD